jgi:hypothetical protein
MKLFDFINSITDTKRNLFQEQPEEKEYLPFIVNKHLSLFPDTIMHANSMNMKAFLSKKAQYSYLLHSIRKRKRFAKWNKKTQNKTVEHIMELYSCSYAKAEQYLSLLSKEQINEINRIFSTKTGNMKK